MKNNFDVNSRLEHAFDIKGTTSIDKPRYLQMFLFQIAQYLVRALILMILAAISNYDVIKG